MRLLTLATLRLPDLDLYAHLLETLDEDAHDRAASRRCVTSQLGEIAAGALRLAHRALETHAHELGYQTGAWVERALERAHARLCGDLERRERPLVDAGAAVRDRAHTRDRGHRRRADARARRARRRHWHACSCST